MSNKNYEVKSVLNLNNEENYMLDDRSEWEAGQMYIDEADLEKARQVLGKSLMEEELFHDESPKVYNGVDWDAMAHLIEIQMFMSKTKTRIDRIEARMEDAKSGNFISRDEWMNLVNTKRKLWSYWNQGKAACQQLVGEDKRMWGIFFNIEDHQEFLKRHLEMDLSIWNTYGRDDEEEESFDKFHYDVVDMLRSAHISEMQEYEKEVFVDWSFHDKRLANRLANEKAQDELLEECPLF